MMTPMNYAALLLVLLAPAGCSRTSHPTATSNDPYDRKGSTAAKQHGVLHLHATYTAPYCGGADPGLEGMPSPHPWQGPLYLRPALPDSTGMFGINDLNIPVLDTLRTDGTGHGYLELPTGTYLLLEQDRLDDRRYRQLLHDNTKATLHTVPIDTACMRRWLHGPFGLITVTGGDTLHVELPMHGQCPWYDTPCVSYFGPLPP